eukprot:TRINITY_DN954_c0_g1_i1.p1 TRINITY_DN954_c0_g1~~TRINITY_DN954_c0_g1_i1.p1  ORF type:complete len:307 (+),score=86.36 TRINITY_DN954_c0_g1_i1:54-923(+)
MGAANSADAPLSAHGSQEVWPMSKFSAEVVGEIYAATARRGNPVLADIPHDVLVLRGTEMAAHARDHPCSFVGTVDGEPCAVWFSWDCADETSFTPHPAFAAHAELHRMLTAERERRLGGQASQRGYAMHVAYCGVLIGKPSVLMYQMNHVCLRRTWFQGYTLQYGAAVNWVTVRDAMRQKPESRWEVQFSDVLLPGGEAPLTGKAPERAVATLLPTWWQAVVGYAIPEWAVPYIAAQRKRPRPQHEERTGSQVAELQTGSQVAELRTAVAADASVRSLRAVAVDAPRG